MSRKGCSPDNAACEGFFGRLKIEMFFSRDWLTTTIEEFVAALDAYIRWYNHVRIKSSLGFRSPAEHRRSLGIAAQPVQVFVRTPGGQNSVGANNHLSFQRSDPWGDYWKAKQSITSGIKVLGLKA